MKSIKLLALVLVLSLAGLACGITITLPDDAIETGPTVTSEINVPSPGTGETAKLTINFGAGKLTLNPGAKDALVLGTATYNVAKFAPEISIRGNTIDISQQDFDYKFSGIPNFNNLKNEWDLRLGSDPMDLEIHAGAYQGQLELGGLALETLTVSDGAADVELSFSEPNPLEMGTLRYSTGASDVTLSGLANANFSEMSFDGGVGNYTLDFSGTLQRDAAVQIDAALSSLTIIVPEGVQVRLIISDGLTSVSVSGAWRGSGSEYSMSGDGPTLTIHVTLGAGSLTLKN